MYTDIDDLVSVVPSEELKMPRLLPLVVACCLGPVVGAHAQILTGNIIGTVRDDSRAVLPGATVSLTSPVLPGTGLSAVTGRTGEYRFPELPPGVYSLTAEL